MLTNTPSWGTFHAYPTVRKLLDNVNLRERSIQAAGAALMDCIHKGFSSADARDIRVLLDIIRGRVTGGKWKGLSLENCVIGSDAGLAYMLSLMQDIARHTQHPLPVLMDENVHYRLMKWMYCRT